MNNRNIELFELFVGFIQLLDYSETMTQVSNNELNNRLEEQNSMYLKTILDNQKIIIKQNNEILKNISKYDKIK